MIGAIAAALVPSLGKFLFGDTGEAVGKAVAGIATEIFGTDDKDQVEKAIAADPNLALKFKEKLLDLRDNEGKRLHERQMAEIGDTNNARAAWSQNKAVVALGFLVIILVSVMNALAVYFAFELLLSNSQMLQGKDAGLIAAVFTFVGNVMGGMQAMGIQAVSFFFGSSKGGEELASKIGTAFSRLGSRS